MQPLWKTARWLFRKLNKLSTCSSDPMPRDIPKRMENRSSEDACMWLDICNSILRHDSGGNKPSVHYRCGYTRSTCTEWSIPGHVHWAEYTGARALSHGQPTLQRRRLEDRPSENTQTQEDYPARVHLHRPCSRQRRRDWKRRLVARGQLQGAGSRCFKVAQSVWGDGNGLEIDNGAGCKHCECI